MLRVISMKIQKVCFFLPSSNRDGAELSALECLDALQSLGIKCLVIVPKNGPLVADLCARQIESQIIPYKVWIEPPIAVWKRLIFTLWNLGITYVACFLVSRQKCDLIITNTVNICVGALVARLLGITHVWYFREFGYEDHGWRFHLGEKLSLRLINSLTNLGLAVSRAVAEKYQAAISGAKIHYLYQPIVVNGSSSHDASPDIKCSQFICIMVGRLQEGKRQEDAIYALADLRDQGILVHLWLVGGGDRAYFDFLKNLVKENKLKSQVKFFGQVNNAFPYIQKADVLLLCSRCDAFARVVVEAMKAGKPVLGTRSGGTVEQIKDGFNGFLYKPRNHKDLAAKIRYLYENPQEAQKMGKNAFQWAIRTFTRDCYQEEIAKILGQL
jgi:glycosyltransferase involved in cell wall biosynthesis